MRARIHSRPNFASTTCPTAYSAPAGLSARFGPFPVRGVAALSGQTISHCWEMASPLLPLSWPTTRPEASRQRVRPAPTSLVPLPVEGAGRLVGVGLPVGAPPRGALARDLPLGDRVRRADAGFRGDGQAQTLVAERQPVVLRAGGRRVGERDDGEERARGFRRE